MKDKLINACKRLKILWDTYKIVKTLIISLGLIGIGSVGYVAYEEDQIIVDSVDDLELIEPEYADKDHTHPNDHGIQKAIEAYDNQHDPQKLKH